MKCNQMFQFPRQSWLHNGLTELKPVPFLTKHSCQWILSPQVSSWFLDQPFPLSSHPQQLSAPLPTLVLLEFQALPAQKRGAILPRIPLPSLGRPRRSAHIAPRAAPWLRDLSLLCVTSSLALNSAGTSMSIPQTLQFTASF